MAFYARVGRETIYSMQAPVQEDANTQPLQQEMTQSNTSAMDQPTSQQQTKFNARKNQPQNCKPQRFGTPPGKTAGKASSGGIVPSDSNTRLAPSSFHPAAPSTPAPSNSTPSHAGESVQQHQVLSSNLRGNQQTSPMTRNSEYIPPHIRKKQRKDASALANNTPPSTGSATVVRPADVESTPAGLAQLELKTVNGQPQAPLSPPPTPAQQNQASAGWGQATPLTDAEAQMNAAWGYEEPTPVPPPQLKTKKRNGWPSPVRKGRHMWPKNRDMRPVTDDEGEWDVEHKSDSNGDPDYDVKKLIDWNGDWLPPPESWSARHTFTDRHFGASIEKWINGHHQSCVVNLTDLLAEADYLGHEVEGGVVLIDGQIVAKQTVNKEIAPRTWIPTRIEGDAPQLFWQALPSRAPPPLSDIDISEYRPFWEEYTQDSDFLNPLQHPAKSVLDMEDEENARPGAGRSLEQNLRNIAQKKTAHNRRRKQKQNRPIAMQELPPPSHPGYRPLANVYFRPVVPADATSIQELYNHYVRQSISVPEFKDRSLNEIVDRIHAITAEGLPYIVAVQKGPRQRGHQDYVNERIVGMAFMDDFCDKGSLYRFTFELEFYVHPDFLRQNIAKCLLDRLLEMVNTSYPAKGGYEWINHGEYLKYGSRRVVKAVLCNVPYPDKEDTKWIGEFMRKFGFHERGDLLKVGHKLGKVVNVLIYQHITSEDIDPSVPPFQPL